MRLNRRSHGTGQLRFAAVPFLQRHRGASGFCPRRSHVEEGKVNYYDSFHYR